MRSDMCCHYLPWSSNWACNVVMIVDVERFKPRPRPRIASNPHCLAAGLVVPGIVDMSPLPISINIPAIFKVQNVRFFLADIAPPRLDPIAIPPISGSSSTPDLTASYVFTI